MRTSASSASASRSTECAGRRPACQWSAARVKGTADDASRSEQRFGGVGTLVLLADDVDEDEYPRSRPRGVRRLRRCGCRAGVVASGGRRRALRRDSLLPRNRPPSGASMDKRIPDGDATLDHPSILQILGIQRVALGLERRCGDQTVEHAVAVLRGDAPSRVMRVNR